MRISDKTLQFIGDAIRPSVQPIIDQDRMLTTDQIRAAIKAMPNLPQIQSERSLTMVLDHICAS